MAFFVFAVFRCLRGLGFFATRRAALLEMGIVILSLYIDRAARECSAPKTPNSRRAPQGGVVAQLSPCRIVPNISRVLATADALRATSRRSRFTPVLSTVFLTATQRQFDLDTVRGGREADLSVATFPAA